MLTIFFTGKFLSTYNLVPSCFFSRMYIFLFFYKNQYHATNWGFSIFHTDILEGGILMGLDIHYDSGRWNL